jgi:hypothetical protein
MGMLHYYRQKMILEKINIPVPGGIYPLAEGYIVWMFWSIPRTLFVFVIHKHICDMCL